jgi:hypothetical protein
MGDLTMIHARPWTGIRWIALLLLLLAPAGCDKVQQQLTGAKDQGPVLQSLRQTLNAKRTRLSGAVLTGQLDFVPRYVTDLNSTLDSLEAQSAKMSLMDGQEMKLKVATARRAVQAAQPFVMQSDVEGLKAAQRNIDQSLFDIDGILDRAIAMADAPPAGGGP